MSNLAQDLFAKYFGPDIDTLATWFPRTSEVLKFSYLEKQEKENEHMFEALKKFVATGELDPSLKIDCSGLQYTDEEPVKVKGRGRPRQKKLSVVSECDPKSVKGDQIKKEKRSDVGEESNPVKPAVQVVKEEMAAPSWIPPKRKVKEPEITLSTRSTRSKARKDGKKDSDIIIQDIPIPTYDLSSPLAEQDEHQKDASTTRSTRSRMRKAKQSTAEVESESKMRSTRSKAKNVPKKTESVIADLTLKKSETDAPKNVQLENANSQENIVAKRTRSLDKSLDAQDNERKKLKPDSIHLEDTSENVSDTLYEDARSTHESLQHPQPTLDATYVAENPIINAAAMSSVLPSLNSTFSVPSKSSEAAPHKDTKASSKVEKSSKKVPLKYGTEVFSPYEKSSTKKKVEAFENLTSSSEIPVKIGSAIKSKPAFGTPLRSTFIPTACSTGAVSKVFSNKLKSSDCTILSAQKDPRERMRKQLEREKALKKKEALLQQQAETKRKLNEERQMRAQQQREAEKLKQLEILKERDDKMKQREREREEKLAKQKQEIENKRLMLKKKQDEVQNQRQKKEEPMYMVTPAPPLPTEQCYDSDDDNYRKIAPPSWCEERRSKCKQLSMLCAGEKIKNTLFCRHAETPDLNEIFQNINPKRLKRTSSMYWKKPPRFTMMPNLNETRFTDDETSD